MASWLNLDDYENLTWINKIDIDEVQSYDGRSKIKDWKPFAIKRIYGREFSNTPGLSSHRPVFDERSVKVVKELLNGYAETLTLACSDGDLNLS